TKATALQAYQNSDVPFQKVVDTVRAGGSGSHNPIFQAMCVVLPVPDAPLALRGVSVRPIDVSTRTSKFDLLVDCMERASSMHVAFEYNTDVFDRTTAERLSARFAHLVREVAARPDAPLSAVPMILDDEAALLAAWNDTDRPLPGVDNVVALVAEAAAASPEAVAVIAGDERVTYRELMGRARQLSTY